MFIQIKLSFLLISIAVLMVAGTSCASASMTETERGQYTFTEWAGGEITVEYMVPSEATVNSPILLVMPGARRNADDYRNQWISLAKQNSFIVLAIGCSLQVCVNEYQYNLGGLTDAEGNLRQEAQQLFSVPELVFNDFVQRHKSTQTHFALYGHSAGGSFVHLYMMSQPEAPVSRAVAGNPAFFVMPDPDAAFPFGLKNSVFTQKDVEQWLNQPLTIILGDQDLGPRTKTLSNSAAANAQGQNVFARGLAFYAEAINLAATRNIQPKWRLEIVQDVGHDSSKIVPHAFRFLFPEMVKE